jgi:hypothetical protein
MNLEDVDRALADWQARLRRIDDNLVSLETSPTCTLLEQAGEDGLDGETRTKVLPALLAMRELFSQRSLLDDVLARAAEIRKGTNRLFPGDALKELEKLLKGPSIALPPVETPMARRGLLDAAETTTSISADQLLAAMVASFEQARDAVAAVDDAWTRLTSEVDRATADVRQLRQLATALGRGGPFDALESRLASVRTRIARDPLGASGAVQHDVEEPLAHLRAELTALDTKRRQVLADLERARSALASLRAGLGRAGDAAARCRTSVILDAPLPAPIDAGRIDGLADWLSTLDATLGSGNWSAVGVGLGRWIGAADQVQADLDAVEKAATGPLAQRDELAGRLSARRQQARTLAARGVAVDPTLEGVADQAERLLRTPPVPLAELARLVGEYDAKLRG